MFTILLSILTIQTIFVSSFKLDSVHSNVNQMKKTDMKITNTDNILIDAIKKYNRLSEYEERNHENEDSYLNYLNNMEFKSEMNKRSRYSDDYTLSEEEKKKIDKAAESAFKKLKKFYIVASRSRFGKRDTKREN